MTIVEARGYGARLRGLAWRDPLPAGLALRLAGCRSVHTFGMRFPLDLVWLDAGECVVRVDRDVGRRRVRVCLGARSVIETRAGGADAVLEGL